ncbi:MAG: baseplate J/gp47 family protein [Alphaproteobacteria bacterium]
MTDETTTENLDISLPNYVDLSTLPAPQVIEELDFETIFAEMLADFKERNTDYDALLESDPVVIALQSCAYREVLLRQRINEAAKASMLAYATGSDLDNLAAFYNVERMLVSEEDLTTTPPTYAVYEDDSRLRLRTQLAMESITTAGSENAYLYHAFSSSVKIKSVNISSINAGEVIITILQNEDTGLADDDLCQEVSDYLNAEDIRPLTDKVIVQSAELIFYSVKAKMYIYSDPSISVIEEEARTNLEEYVSKRHKIGEVMATSGIYQALHTEGVQKIELIEPTSDITTTNTQATYCEEIEIEVITVNDE